MDTQANYRLVGLFVVLSALALAAALFWLANAGSGRDAEYYTVYFREHSLSGLQKDSYVTMKGIKVGSVDDYRISPENIEEVRVTLRLDGDLPVKTTTKAIVTRNLLTGIAAIELTGGSHNDPELTQAAPGNPYPIIPEGTSPLDKITDSIPALLERVGGLANRVEAFASEENIKAWSGILANLESLTGWLAESRTRIESLIKELESVSKDISEVSKTISEFTTDTNKELVQTAQEAQDTLKQINRTFEELQVQTRTVSTSLSNASQVFSQEVTTVGQSISEAADSFSKTVEGFEDPRTLITGPRRKAFGPGESLPK